MSDSIGTAWVAKAGEAPHQIVGVKLRSSGRLFGAAAERLYNNNQAR